MRDSPLILPLSLKHFPLGLVLLTTSVFGYCGDNEQQHEVATQEQQSGLIARPSLFQKRFEADKNLLNNAFAITQYKRNYFLPFTYVDNPNALGNAALTENNVDNKEAKFQISVKLPLYTQPDSVEGVYFGFTLTSFWQLYNSEVSKPFRETNYEPEVFLSVEYRYKTPWYRF